MVRLKRQSPAAASPRRQPADLADARRPVFSYHSQRSRASEGDNTRSSRPADTPRGSSTSARRWLKNAPSLVALIIIVGCVLYCLGLTTNAKVVGDELNLRTKDEYQQGAHDILQQSLLNRTKLTVNTGHFERAFREQFPEVADVALSLPLISRRPVVTVSTAQPALIFITQDQAYVLDNRGIAIMKGESLPEATRQKLPVVQDQSNASAELGKGVLSAEDVEFIGIVLEQLNAKGVSVQAITLPTRAHQVDMRINGQPYYVKFSVDSDAREAAGTFLATKAQLERENKVPAEYIDVRVDGRAYYK